MLICVCLDLICFAGPSPEGKRRASVDQIAHTGCPRSWTDMAMNMTALLLSRSSPSPEHSTAFSGIHDRACRRANRLENAFSLEPVARSLCAFWNTAENIGVASDWASYPGS